MLIRNLLKSLNFGLLPLVHVYTLPAFCPPQICRFLLVPPDTTPTDCINDSSTTNTTIMPKNSAFVFIKPHANRPAVQDLVKAKLEEAGLSILSTGSISGVEIDEKQYIDQHYYAIASKATILKPEEIAVPADKFEAEFGETWSGVLESGKAYNAMQACEKLGVDAEGLETVW